MQSTKIKFGSEYAVMFEKKLARFRVISQTTVRDSKGSVNSFTGYINRDDGSEQVQAKFDADQILNEFETYKELVDAKKAHQARLDAAEKARAGKLRATLDALTNFFGFEAIDHKRSEKGGKYGSGDWEYNRGLPIRSATGGNIEIDEEAFDVLLSRLSPEWKEPVVSKDDPLLGFRAEEAN